MSIHVVMQVTKEIATYGRRTAAANAIWARSHSHTMSVHGPLGGSRPAPRGYDARFGKVQFLRKSAEGAQEDAQNEHKWLLWLDADAFVAVHHDWAKEVILRFGSAAHVIASLDPGEDGTLNTGVLLVKRSAWSVNFLNDWWLHPSAQQGKTDQAVLDEVLVAMRAAGESVRFVSTDPEAVPIGPVDAKVVVLPVGAINCDQKWWQSFIPSVSPVLHLMNHGMNVREKLGTEILQRLWCGASSGAYESPEAAIASQKLEWLEPHYEQVLRNCSFDEFDGRCTELLLNFLLDKGRAADAEAAWQYGVETGMLNVGGAQNAASFFSQYSRAHAATNGELYISLNQLETTFKERLNRARSAHATGSTTKPLKLVQYYRSAVSALRREHSTRFDMMAKLHGTIGMLLQTAGSDHSDTAEDHLQLATEYDPQNWRLKSNLAAVLASRPRPNVAQALRVLQDALDSTVEASPAFTALEKQRNELLSGTHGKHVGGETH